MPSNSPVTFIIPWNTRTAKMLAIRAVVDLHEQQRVEHDHRHPPRQIRVELT